MICTRCSIFVGKYQINIYLSPFVLKTVLAPFLFDTKKWYFQRIFKLTPNVVRLKGLVKVPLFCVKQRLCKHCLRNKNLVQLNEHETAPYLFSTLVRSPAVRLRLVRCTAWVKRWSEAMDFLQTIFKKNILL